MYVIHFEDLGMLAENKYLIDADIAIIMTTELTTLVVARTEILVYWRKLSPRRCASCLH